MVFDRSFGELKNKKSDYRARDGETRQEPSTFIATRLRNFRAKNGTYERS